MSMSARLNRPVPYDEIFEILRRNMCPGLQLALANMNFCNMDKLFSQAVSLGPMWSRLGYNPEAFITSKRI